MHARQEFELQFIKSLPNFAEGWKLYFIFYQCLFYLVTTDTFIFFKKIGELWMEH